MPKLTSDTWIANESFRSPCCVRSVRATAVFLGLQDILLVNCTGCEMPLNMEEVQRV